MSALKMIQSELDMPYVPKEILETLQSAYKECDTKIKESIRSRVLSIEEIEEALQQDEEHQIMAVNALNKINLRDEIDLVKNYLSKSHSQMAGSLLMESLIQQQISEEITVVTKENEVTFIPRYTELPYESDGFKGASSYLENWFESQDPGFYQLCMQILIQEAYLALPINFEEDESLILACTIARYVFKCMDKEDEFEQFITEKDLNCPFYMDLKCILL